MAHQDDSPLSLLTGTSHPQLAEALRDCVPTILRRWERIVCEVLPKADELTLSQLRDDLPKILMDIADALEMARQHHPDQLLKLTAEHGLIRQREHYDLNELLIEYDLLRPVMIEELVRHLARRTTVEETVALNAGIDLCSRRAVIAFVENQSTQLKAATEAQSKYLSFLSHDLRGGLNGVFLTIEVLRRDLEPETRFAESIADLDSMRRTLLETVATMDRFLHAERFRKGMMTVHPAPLSLRSLLTELAGHFLYQSRQQQSPLHVVADEGCKIVSDRSLLTMIFQNLLSNALKYAPGAPIRILADCQSDGGVSVTIADGGPGIAPEKLAQLFAPFARGEAYGQPGVGLGLSIARQAAELLGAKLWAESAVGRGSRFVLAMPPGPPSSRAQLATP